MKREDLISLGIEGENLDKVMALHGAGIEKHKLALQELENKYSSQVQDMQNQLSAQQYKTLTDKELSVLNFTSNSAKTAFHTALNEANLPVEDGKLVGYTEFLEKYKKDDEQAFVSPNAQKAPVFVQSTAATQESDNALRAAFGL